MKKLKSTFLVLLMATICLVVYYVAIAITSDNTTTGNPNEGNTAQEENTENQTGEEPKDDEQSENDSSTDEIKPVDKVTVSLVAVGDNFAHESVIESGKQSDGTYNFDFLFDGIRSYVEGADIAAIYQTMIMAGNDKGVAGYPSFNTPEEMMDAIAKAGFNVALMASNHSTDMGTDGISSCLELWKEFGTVKAVGIYKAEADAAEIPVIEVKGRKIAVLNYTYGLNKPITDKNQQYMVDYLGKIDSSTGVASSATLSDAVLDDIKKAEELADYVIVFPCWGDEYTFVTGNAEKKWAKQMTEAGADLIIGAHTHYIGEVEQITADNGNTSMCYYSIGNFCSTFNNSNTMVGAMAKVNIVFDGDNVYIDEDTSGIVPIITHYTHSGNAEDEMATVVGVYPLSQYTSDMAKKHGIITRGNTAFSMDIIMDIINTNVKEEYLLD